MFYPVNLVIKNKKALIIGGGQVAYRKARSLEKTGAKVIVVSQSFIPKFKTLRTIKLIKGNFKANLLKDAFLVICVTDDKKLNEKIANVCQKNRVIVNVCDNPDFCTFTVPSVLKRGALTFAISTDNLSPGLARQIRLELKRLYPESFAKFLDMVARIRKIIQNKMPPSEKRLRLLRNISSKHVINTFRRYGLSKTRALLERML